MKTPTPSTWTLTWTLTLTLTALSCAATAPGGAGVPREATDPSDVAEMNTPLPLAGSRCASGSCACRPIDAYGLGTGPDADREAAPPAPGLKRFELRTGRGDDAVQITIEGIGTFTRRGGPEPACVYVDLPPGPHRVRYHVIAADPERGVEPRLRISEYGEASGRWYRSFAFRCAGGQGHCTRDDARDALAALGAVPRGIHDPCGSARIQGLRFWSERPAEAYLADFNLQLVLNVYRFAPQFPPDSPQCARGRRKDGE